MAQPCTVCRHPERDRIDDALVSGEGYRGIGQRFGVSPSALSRHRQRHLSPALIALAAEREDQKKERLVDRLEVLIDRAETLYNAACDDGRSKSALDTLKEMRELLRLLGQATGELKEAPQVAINILQAPEWLAVRECVFAALAAHPDARAAVAGRLLELEAGS